MSSTRTLMKALVAGLDAVDPETLDTYISIAARRVDAAEFGVVYEDAVALYAGHLYQRKNRTQYSHGVGALTSKSTGPLSESYGSGAQGDEDFKTTPAGVDYIALRNTHVMGIRMV